MNIFGALKREIRGSPAASDDFWYTPLGRVSDSGVKVTEQGSLKLAAVWACVRLLSNALACTPAILYRRVDAGKEREQDDPMFRIFRRAFNPRLTAFRGFQTMMAHVLTWGNAYAFRETATDGRTLMGLHPLRPDLITPRLAKDGDEIGTKKRRPIPREIVYESRLAEGTRVYGRDEIFHVPGLGFDGIKGYNPIEYGLNAIGRGLAVQKFNAKWFKDGASPSGIVTYPAKLKPELREDFKKEVKAKYAGLGNAHSLMVLENQSDFKPVGLSPEQSQMTESLVGSVVEVARFFGVQPHKIAELTRSTNNNIEHQGLEFLQDTMLPWFTLWESEIALQIVGLERPLFIEFLADNLLRMDANGRVTLYKGLWEIAALTSNEARAKENMNSYGPEGDVYHRPLNFAPVGQPLPERPAAQRELRAARRRKRLQDRFRPQYKATFQKVVNGEVREIRKAVESVLGRRDVPDFKSWLRRFYEEHAGVIETTVAALYLAYIAAIRAEALDETDFEPVGEDAFAEDWSAGYVGIFVTRHVGSSRRQLEALTDGATVDEAVSAVTVRLEEWVEKRAGKIADDEVVQVDGLVTRATYREAGVTKLVWRASGSENCPYCEELDGRVVGLDAPFVGKGEDFQPGGAERPLTSSKNVLNPPLHQGCDCQIEPA